MSITIANRKPNQRKIAPVRVAKKIEVEQRGLLRAMMEPLTTNVTEVIKLLGENPDPRQAINALKALRIQWGGIFGSKAQVLGERWAKSVSYASKRRLEQSLQRAIGIDAAMIFDSPAVHDMVLWSADEAARLIANIPEDYIGRVSQAVVQSIRQQPFENGRSLIQELMHIGGYTKERAALIARDQTSKMNAVINEARQLSIGIEEYIWRTSEDQRVVGNPSGLYPVGNAKHGNHYERNGKIFRWDKPPSDGHAGYPIGCRCISIPVVDRSLLKGNDQTGYGLSTSPRR